MKNNKRGFTLIELMIVLSIIAILAVVLIPRAVAAKNSARDAGVIANIRTVKAQAEAIIENGTDPDDFALKLKNALDTQVVNPISKNNNTVRVVSNNSYPDSSTLIKPGVIIYDLPASTTNVDWYKSYFDEIFDSNPSANIFSKYTCNGSVVVLTYVYNGVLTTDIYGVDSTNKPVENSSYSAAFEVKQ